MTILISGYEIHQRDYAVLKKCSISKANAQQWRKSSYSRVNTLSKLIIPSDIYTAKGTYPFLGSCKLQNLCNASQIASLVIRQCPIRWQCYNIKSIRSHNSRVDVIVINQITHNLFNKP